MFKLLAVIATALVGAIASTTGVAAADLSYDKVQPAWVGGQVTTVYVQFPQGPPTPERLDAYTYVIAPIDADNPQDPGGVYPPPPGSSEPFIAPAQDQVMNRRIPTPSDCFGWFVKAGSAGDSTTVRTRIDPNGSDLVLAYAVNLWGVWYNLTSQEVIQAGVAQNLLYLDRILPSDPPGSVSYGGICWTQG